MQLRSKNCFGFKNCIRVTGNWWSEKDFGSDPYMVFVLNTLSLLITSPFIPASWPIRTHYSSSHNHAFVGVYTFSIRPSSFLNILITH